MTTFEVATNKIRLALLTLAFLTAVTLAAIVACFILDEQLILVLIFAIPSVFFIVWFAVKNISSNKPGLVLNSKGIIDNINLTEAGIITWNNIIHTHLVKYQHSYFIVFQLKDNDAVLGNLSKHRLKLAKNNSKVFGTPAAINVSNLKIDKFKLLEIFNNRIQAL